MSTKWKYGKKSETERSRVTGKGDTKSRRPRSASNSRSPSPDRHPPGTMDEVGERLSKMRPSRELLDYYRRKVSELAGDHEGVVRKLESLGDSCRAQEQLQWDLKQREDEIAELQRALSDMQIYLFQEREQVLRLYAENDRLKIRELEDRKKIQHLLQLSGLHESEVTYFLKEPPSKAVFPLKPPPPGKGGKMNGLVGGEKGKPTGGSVPLLEHESTLREVESYRLQVQSLQSQLEEQTRLAKEQSDALLEDRRVRMEEVEAQRKRDQDRLKGLTEQLKKTQDLLYDSTKDFLEQRQQFRKTEKTWIGEKDRLLRRLDSKPSAPSVGERGVGRMTPELLGTEVGVGRAWVEVAGQLAERKAEEYRASIRNLEYQLEQQQKLADMYREQVIQMEDDLSRIREEGDVSKELFKDRSEKISKRLQMMNQRYQDLERRRNLEVQGFKTDIANLRKKLRNLEKQLYKVTLGLGDDLNLERPEDVDMAILKNVRATAGHSKKLAGELKNLKAMVYGLENEMRQL